MQFYYFCSLCHQEIINHHLRISFYAQRSVSAISETAGLSSPTERRRFWRPGPVEPSDRRSQLLFSMKSIRRHENGLRYINHFLHRIVGYTRSVLPRILISFFKIKDSNREQLQSSFAIISLLMIDKANITIVIK